MHFATTKPRCIKFRHCLCCIDVLVIFVFKQVAQRATIAHLRPMCQGQISFQKIQTHPRFNACSCYMKVSKGSNQKQQRKSGNIIFPIIRSIEVFLKQPRKRDDFVFPIISLWEKQPRKRDDFLFPIISLWEFFPKLKGS